MNIFVGLNLSVMQRATLIEPSASGSVQLREIFGCLFADAIEQRLSIQDRRILLRRKEKFA